jgi:hypothetical protein
LFPADIGIVSRRSRRFAQTFSGKFHLADYQALKFPYSGIEKTLPTD